MGEAWHDFSIHRLRRQVWSCWLLMPPCLLHCLKLLLGFFLRGRVFLLTRHDILWFRFQGQSELSYYNPCDFQMAIEEAFLADQGYTEKLIADINAAAGNSVYDDTIMKSFQEVTGSNQYAGNHFLNQVSRGIPPPICETAWLVGC